MLRKAIAQTIGAGARSFHASTPVRAPSRVSRACTEKHIGSQCGPDVVILSTARTPIGSYQGTLASVTATQLGTHVVKEALTRAKVTGAQVNEVILGNVVSSGTGQAPATQVTFRAGIPFNVPSTTVNKVCASGMKTVMFGAQSIELGQNQVVVAGGMESMSNIPFYLPKARAGMPLGHGQVLDGIITDGLWDAFDNHHMGNAAEACATQYKFNREQADEFALESFRRAQNAQKNGLFKDEIAPITVKDKKGEVVVSEDESPAKLKADKLRQLKPVFVKDGTVTAANASSINDGACALVLSSGAFAQSQGLKPVARIIGYADAQQRPLEFTTTPSIAIPKALKIAGISLEQVDAIEINEAFAVVALANIQLLKLDPAKVNINGGAVALGHPIGCSGARIIGTLIQVLKQKKGKYGVASICNGGGGASAVVVELL